MNAKQVKQFFLVILIAAILGALTSCSERKSRSGQALEKGPQSVPIENAQILLATGIFKAVGDTTLVVPTAVIGTGKSTIYQKSLYKLSRTEATYVRINY
jgi:hypothetical protein